MRLTVFVIAILCAAAGVAMAVGLEVVVLDQPGVDRCPVCKRTIYPGEIHQDAATAVTNQFQESLDQRQIRHTSGKEEGRRLNVVVYRFQERRGGNFSVERPASVGLHIHLLEGSTLGRVIAYDETQEAISDNIFGLFRGRSGFRWLTAPELARKGINKAVDKLQDELQ